jgi:hypothetical protein
MKTVDIIVKLQEMEDYNFNFQTKLTIGKQLE